MSDIRFDNFIKFILDHETEYKKGHWGNDKYVLTENDPDDPGGITKYGIDKRSHPNIDIPNLTKEQAISVYYKEYWIKFKCSQLSSPLGEVYFDTCVNCGSNRADKFLKPAKDANNFIELREGFYRRLADARPESKKYLPGWLNRCKDLRIYLRIK